MGDLPKMTILGVPPWGPPKIFEFFFAFNLNSKGPSISSESLTLNITTFGHKKCQNGHFWCNSQAEIDKILEIF